ncbi:MAG TPA: S8 family serine peptidase [Candidatus Elarobacter sp.]
MTTPVRYVAFLLAAALASCGGGGGGSTVPQSTGTTPTPTPTPVATTPPVGTQAAYTCPSSDVGTTSVARGTVGGTADAVRQRVARFARDSQPSATLLAVTYDSATATRSSSSIARAEQSAGGTVVNTLAFSHIGRTVHVISVAAGQAAAAAAKLRAQAGVVSVAATGYRRHVASVSTPYYTNDPYFAGFSSAGTYHSGLSETATVPGQWDMHAIGLEYAFGYSQPSNGSGIQNANALGSSAVKVAVIDTGEDTLHPELTSKIAYQKCFITGTNNLQSVGNYTTDPQGHGTDVAGLAGAATNNGFGFAGAGGNVSLMAYRIFPTPDDNCTSDTTTDNQCSTSTPDVASAINDAVAHGANVITMSLGGNACSSAGVDSDPTEGAAIANAIAANVVVVAAAGNDGSSGLEAPACDAGVIAVGASALGDGSTNGSGTSVGSATSPVEYVASYSDWGSPAAAPKSASAWGIVAPGGDPNTSNDNDDLHWIEHIWTSQPFDANFAGECTDDFPNSSGTASPVDCRTLIAGTSMATPHVAGAAALIIAVNSAYQNPTAMKTLLCTTADDIGAAHEGCGRLNVYRAMAKALGDANLP